ncbi:MAG: radical SAM protein, partial [Candidatus Methylomirabilis sp.]|nr:radical SAM protein [Deltaproteobacteria bacterium]
GRGFDYTVNLATGCTVDCAFCYVPAIFRATRPAAAAAWGTEIEVKANAAALLREAGARGQLTGKAIYISSVTEPFLPAVEPVTRAVLAALAEFPPRRVVLQTHLHRVADCLDALLPLGGRVAISLSVPTDSESVRRLFEPRASPIPKRLEALARLRDAGVEACLTVAPVLPILDPERFARETEPLARAAIFSPFHAPKQSGRAGTRDRAVSILEAHPEWGDWLDPKARPEEAFQVFRRVWGAERVGYDVEGFARLARGDA